jgi:hypothetical protein
LRKWCERRHEHVAHGHHVVDELDRLAVAHVARVLDAAERLEHFENRGMSHAREVRFADADQQHKLAGPRLRRSAAQRAVDDADATLARCCVNGAHRSRQERAQLDQRGVSAHALQQPARRQKRAGHRLVIRQARQQELEPRQRVRLCGPHANRLRLAARLWTDVESPDLVPRLDEPLGKGAAHDAEADEREARQATTSAAERAAQEPETAAHIRW